MKERNIVLDKSFAFAIRIVKLSKCLRNEHGEYELASQVIRSGTSIGANAEEAQEGQSRADFISKMSIALKEARETIYWLRLIKAAGIIVDQIAIESLLDDAHEIRRIISSIVKSTKENTTR